MFRITPILLFLIPLYQGAERVYPRRVLPFEVIRPIYVRKASLPIRIIKSEKYEPINKQSKSQIYSSKLNSTTFDTPPNRERLKKVYKTIYIPHDETAKNNLTQLSTTLSTRIKPKLREYLHNQEYRNKYRNDEVNPKSIKSRNEPVVAPYQYTTYLQHLPQNIAPNNPLYYQASVNHQPTQYHYELLAQQPNNNRKQPIPAPQHLIHPIYLKHHQHLKQPISYQFYNLGGHLSRANEQVHPILHYQQKNQGRNNDNIIVKDKDEADEQDENEEENEEKGNTKDEDYDDEEESEEKEHLTADDNEDEDKENLEEESEANEEEEEDEEGNSNQHHSNYRVREDNDEHKEYNNDDDDDEASTGVSNERRTYKKRKYSHKPNNDNKRANSVNKFKTKIKIENTKEANPVQPFDFFHLGFSGWPENSSNTKQTGAPQKFK